MTFYNVISGILFLAACQSFLQALGSSAMWVAAILVITILNESVLTSDLVERETNAVPYTLSLKLLDFVTFTVFSWLLLVLNPETNAFDVNVESALLGANDPRFFWSLMVAYWLLMLVWNQLAGQRVRAKWKTWFFNAMHLMWVPPLVALVVNWNTVDLGSQAAWSVWLNLGAISVYLLSKVRAAV